MGKLTKLWIMLEICMLEIGVKFVCSKLERCWASPGAVKKLGIQVLLITARLSLILESWSELDLRVNYIHDSGNSQLNQCSWGKSGNISSLYAQSALLQYRYPKSEQEQFICANPFQTSSSKHKSCHDYHSLHCSNPNPLPLTETPNP